MTSETDFTRLDSFADLTVPIEVRIGQCRMRVQQIAALGNGSTVALDRPAGEMLELIVGNVRVGLVEVVVVEDQLAIRVTELDLPSRPRTVSVA